MKILITGICGFVGSTLALKWRESAPDVHIVGVDNLARPGSELNRQRLYKHGIKLFHADIRMQSDMDVLPEVDWVIDAAANSSVLAGIDGETSSRQLIEHNLTGTVNLLEYSKRHRAGFILISTSRVYSIKPLVGLNVTVSGKRFCLSEKNNSIIGLSDKGIDETFSTSPPVSLYGSSKLAGEVLALEYGEAFDFPVWINRCGLLAGAGQFGRADQGIISYWINAWLRKKPLKYIGFGGNGCQVRDALHPQDLLPLLQHQTLNNTGKKPQIINIGGNQKNSFSLAELSNWCFNRFGPHPVAGSHEIRRFDIPWLIMDTALAEKTWEWRPKTSLECILSEIAHHAELHPDWLELSGRA